MSGGVGLQDMKDIKSIRLFGTRVDVVDTQTTLDTIDGFFSDGKPHMVVTADTSCIVIAQSDPELMSIVNDADLVTPDGVGILWAARRIGVQLKERVSGVDIVQHLCELGASCGRRVFLLGAAPGIAEAAGMELEKRCPGLRVVGTHDGFFTEEESEGIADTIRGVKPDMLFVAMGIPRQEKWIKENLARMGVPVCIGVGGTFDVISGNVKRAPVWMQKRGLEWVYRVITNPRKIKKVMTLPVFAWMVLTTKNYGP